MCSGRKTESQLIEAQIPCNAVIKPSPRCAALERLAIARCRQQSCSQDTGRTPAVKAVGNSAVPAPRVLMGTTNGLLFPQTSLEEFLLRLGGQSLRDRDWSTKEHTGWHKSEVSRRVWTTLSDVVFKF